jgi:hypothetical protein
MREERKQSEKDHGDATRRQKREERKEDGGYLPRGS